MNTLTATTQSQSEDRTLTSALSIEFIRVADNYTPDRFEVAQELGLGVCPNWYRDDDVDTELKEQHRAWIDRYNDTVEGNPAAYQRALVRIRIRYAKELFKQATEAIKAGV